MKKQRIAIYGKGGIGKTTISVNLALTLAREGYKVLLVGCDPKQDTARLLLQERLPTIVECYDGLQSGRIPIERVCARVRENITCCEAGGPKPGVGCAGRGVLIALDLLSQRGILSQADVVLYDVLGDVVCGGFATPVTHGFTDRIYVVTSGEQASLLAANNILSGMNSVGGKTGGLIFNARGFEGEETYVRRFASLTGVPIVGVMPYSQRIKTEELNRRAICEADGAVLEEQAMRALANEVLNGTPCQPRALTPDGLYDMIAQIGRERHDR